MSIFSHHSFYQQENNCKERKIFSAESINANCVIYSFIYAYEEVDYFVIGNSAVLELAELEF